jgi:hypothetical protein
MTKRTATLLELTLIEQEVRNAAALVAIRSRATDIAELQRLAEALGARGLQVKPSVSTHPVGAQSMARLHLWLSCTQQELGTALDWLVGADVGVTRIAQRDTGRMRTYELMLRATTVQLNATVHEPPPRYAFPFQPAAA